MASKFTITEKVNDAGVVKWLETQTGKGQQGVTVGIQGPGVNAIHAHSGDFSEGEALTVGEVAFQNEYGVGVPERPFVRGYVDAHSKEILAEMIRLVQYSAQKLVPLQDTLKQIGTFVQTGMKEFIMNKGEGTYPPNTAYTVKKKGGNIPLFDTGRLIDTIKYKVLFRPGKRT